jgi:hypothetical protein
MALLSAPQLPEDPQNDWRSKGFFTVVASCAVGFSLTKFVLGMQASHRAAAALKARCQVFGADPPVG